MTMISGLAVLVVEDEFLVALDAESMIRTLGAASIEVVGTFEDAERRLTEGTYDLVLLDVNLNGQMSFPLGRIAQSRGIPVVFATGYTPHTRSLADFESGVRLAKSYTPESLTVALMAALEAKAASPVTG